MIDIKPPSTGDAYLDKFQDVAHELHNLIEYSEKARVLVLIDFLKDIDWLLCVGHKAYMNNSSDDLHEISKTLKDILREMRKRKV